MLLKYTQTQKRIKATGIGKPQRTAGGMVKLTSGLMNVMPKIHRKVIKVASKRPAAIHRALTAVKREQIPVDPCENSNDSGLGFDHHLDYHTSHASHSALPFSDKEAGWQAEEPPEVKRRRLEIKLESDDANDNFTFPETVRQQIPRTICIPLRGRANRVVVPVTLTSQLSATSQSGLTQLLIVCQPEQQHRARYQTEGSRGAVKDRTGNGFPVVKLVGYDRPASLQVFIGTDQGRVAPHMFYQACRVSGKNSTPCMEKKIDGTIVIEVDVEPSKDMVVTCDCVGILKERNVDVEHRFPEEGSGRSKKKSTRCRMVFRTTITNADGTQETLQVTSQPIVCTQPPGVPEICKKSLSSCSVRGGQELFILGKNFLKDTRVVFQEGDSSNLSWSQSVQPDKEFLQQSHLVCVVPAYRATDISEPVSVRLVVESSGKASEPHTFLYLPDSLRPADTSVLAPEGNIVNNSVITQGGSSGVFPPHLAVAAPLLMPPEQTAPTFLASQTSPGAKEKVVMMWEKPSDIMMPPPAPMLPITVRRSSIQMIVPEQLAPEDLKQEKPDPPKPVANITNAQQTSMDSFHRFVSNNPLPSINVGNYLSNIEANGIYSNKEIKPQIMNEMPRIMIPSPASINKSLFPVNSSNLLTTVEPVLVNQPVPIPFDNRNMSINSSGRQSPQENMSVIVNSSMMQKKLPDAHANQEGQLHKQMPESQNVGMDILMTSTINKRATTVTERLDAFVNSAAESHISPTPTSPIAMTSVITENSVMNPVSEMAVTGSSKVHTPTIQMSPCTSPHHGTNMNDGSLCTLLNTSVQGSPDTSSNEAQSVQASLDHHLNNQNMNTTQANISIIQASSQVQRSHSQEYTLEQQLSQPITSSQISQNDISTLMQSSSQTSASQAQALSDLQKSLEQQLSPQPLNASQLNHADINNLMQTTPQISSHSQGIIQVSLEQSLTSQSMSTSQINHSNLDNLIQSSAQDTRIENGTLSNLHASLEQLSSQPGNSTQIIHSESVQSNSLPLNSISNTIHTSIQPSEEVQTLSNLHASLECHLNSQVIHSVQTGPDSLTSGSITSQQIQAAVSEAQAISNIQASLEHHLSAQVIGSAQNMLDSISQNTSNKLNSAIETPDASVGQSQTLSNLQMSLGHLTSQVLTSVQSSQEPLNTNTISLNNSMQTPQVSVESNQEQQALSHYQTSLDQLTSQVMSANQSSSESLLSLERLNNPIQPPQIQTSNQPLSSYQASIEHLSSQVLNSGQPGLTESLTSNKVNLNEHQTLNLSSPITLMNSQPGNVSSTCSTSGSIRLSSPTSRHSPPLVLASSGISNCTIPLSTSNLAIHSSQPMDISPPNMVLGSSQTLMATDLTVGNPSVHSLGPTELQIHNPQNATLQPSNISQFEQVTSNISQRLPVQVGNINQYKQQCEEVDNTNKEPERKEPSNYIISSEAATGQAPRVFERKQQVPVPVVKKCEEGMPLPHELTQMSENDLISYINPSCFDTV